METASQSDSSRYVIPVVRNTFQVIHELAQTGALTLNEAARRTGIPKSTAFRILLEQDATITQMPSIREHPRAAIRLSVELA